MPDKWLAWCTMPSVKTASMDSEECVNFPSVLTRSWSYRIVDLIADILCCCHLCMIVQMVWFNMICRVEPLALGVTCMQLNEHQFPYQRVYGMHVLYSQSSDGDDEVEEASAMVAAYGSDEVDALEDDIDAMEETSSVVSGDTSGLVAGSSVPSEVEQQVFFRSLHACLLCLLVLAGAAGNTMLLAWSMLCHVHVPHNVMHTVLN